MSNALIRAGFESALATWAAAQSPAIPVAYENVPFTPPAGRYLRAYHLPNNTETDDLQQAHRRYQGFFQVSIVMPIGTGAGAAAALEASIASLYPTTAPMTSGAIRIFLTAPMSAGPAQTEPDRYVVPLSAPYRVDTV